MKARHLLIIALVAGCAPRTQLVNTWRDPAADSVRFNKILAVCACKDPSIRRTVEDQLAKTIDRSQPSYAVLSESQLQNGRAARSAIEKGGFDGVVVVNLVNADAPADQGSGQSYVVPLEYRGIWGGISYRRDDATVNNPGEAQTGKFVNFDTNVYSVKDQMLVWASRSQTDDPQSVRQLVDDIVAATAKEMKRQKLVD